jgi:hypothetical protein
MFVLEEEVHLRSETRALRNMAAARTLLSRRAAVVQYCGSPGPLLLLRYIRLNISSGTLHQWSANREGTEEYFGGEYYYVTILLYYVVSTGKMTDRG